MELLRHAVSHHPTLTVAVSLLLGAAGAVMVELELERVALAAQS